MTTEPDGPLHPDRRAAAGSFALATLLTAVAAWLGLGLQRDGIAVFWPAAGALAGLMAATPRGVRRVAAFGGASVALGAANALLGRSPAVSLVFLSANLGEGLLVAVLLARASGGMRFDALRPVVAFLLACAVAPAAVGAVAATALVATGFSGEWSGAWRSWFLGHGVGLLTVAPAVAMFAAPAGPRGPRGRLWAAFAGHWRDAARIALLAAVAHGLMGWMPQAGGLGTLVTTAVLYALLLWIVVRGEPSVSGVALLVLAAVVVWHGRYPGGAMGDDPYPPAILLVAASMWTLTLGALLSEQRRTLRAVSDSELGLRQAMQVGRAFAFDWDPIVDRVERTDTSGVLGGIHVESSVTYFEGIDPRDRLRFEQTLAALTPQRPSYLIRYRYRRVDGRTIWLEERALARFDASGRMVRLQGMSADVTERQEAVVALREADSAKDRFIATLSHELRNPLAPIRNASEILRRLAGRDEAVARCHAIIDRQLRQMVYLLDELLDVGRISQGKLRLAPRRIDLSEVLEPACANLREPLEELGQRLEVEAPAGPVRLMADPVRLVQAIGNLLGNASKYSPRGARIGLQVTVEPGDGRDVLVVAVRDEGVGLAEADTERVFDMFSQLEPPDGATRGGLGIGLWLVRQIVTMQGGTVTACSDGPGRGSVFTIRLPVVEPPEGAGGWTAVGRAVLPTS